MDHNENYLLTVEITFAIYATRDTTVEDVAEIEADLVGRVLAMDPETYRVEVVG